MDQDAQRAPRLRRIPATIGRVRCRRCSAGMLLPRAVGQQQRGIRHRPAVGGRGHGIHDPSLAVLRQHMPQLRQPRRLLLTTAVRQRLGIATGLLRGVRAAQAAELAILRVCVLLAPEALLGGRGLDESPSVVKSGSER